MSALYEEIKRGKCPEPRKEKKIRGNKKEQVLGTSMKKKKKV
jgi:hypothetical protein